MVGPAGPAAVRSHVRWYWVLLGSVTVGLLLHPGRAYSGGRLTDIVWPVQATEVGHYAAVSIGLVVVLWLGGLQRGRITLCVVAIAGILLLLSHTRTALIAMVAGILGRRPEPVRNEKPGAQVFRGRRCRGVDRGRDGGQRDDDLAGRAGRADAELTSLTGTD